MACYINIWSNVYGYGYFSYKISSLISRAILSILYLDGIKKKHSLDISLFLNSEPSFTQRPEDPNYYIYSGSIGKIMPSALFYGIETHAGEPLRGLNAYYMASFLNRQMEFTDTFSEE